jgi:hypothetical protein
VHQLEATGPPGVSYLPEYPAMELISTFLRIRLPTVSSRSCLSTGKELETQAYMVGQPTCDEMQGKAPSFLTNVTPYGVRTCSLLRILARQAVDESLNTRIRALFLSGECDIRLQCSVKT